MDIVLYYAPNTCALVPFVALTEAGASFRVEALNFRKKEQMSAGLPAPQSQDTRCPCFWWTGKASRKIRPCTCGSRERFPAARLMPDDPWLFVQAISVASWCSSGIHPNLSLINTPSKCCDAPGSEESVRRLARAALDENFAIADQMLAGREFLFDHFSTADAHLFWCLRRAVAARIRHCALGQLQELLRARVGAPERAEGLRVREGDARALCGVTRLT